MATFHDGSPKNGDFCSYIDRLVRDEGSRLVRPAKQRDASWPSPSAPSQGGLTSEFGRAPESSPAVFPEPSAGFPSQQPARPRDRRFPRAPQALSSRAERFGRSLATLGLLGFFGCAILEGEDTPYMTGIAALCFFLFLFGAAVLWISRKLGARSPR